MRAHFFCIVLLTVLLAGCGSELSYLRQAISSSASSEAIEAEGETLTLVEYQTAPAGERNGDFTVFFVGGSGCVSLQTYLAPYFSAAPNGMKITGLEKVGAERNSFGRTCSDEFWRNYQYGEMLRRNELALKTLGLRHGRPFDALIGVSEGGPIALELAARNPEIARIVIVGAGGLSQREELQILADQSGTRRQIETALNRIDADPDNGDAWTMGYPNTYWSAVLDRDPSQYLSAVRQRALVVIGENDTSVPVASAERLRDFLPNAQLVIWPDADHAFKTPTGDERDTMVQVATEFLLTGSVAATE